MFVAKYNSSITYFIITGLLLSGLLSFNNLSSVLFKGLFLTITFFITMSSILYLVKTSKINYRFFFLLLTFLFIILLSVLSSFAFNNNEYSSSFKSFYQLFFIFSTIYFFYIMGSKINILPTLKKLRYVLVQIVIILFLLGSFIGFHNIFSNPNALGLYSVSLFFTFLFLSHFKNNKILTAFILLIIFILIVYSDSRTSLLSAITGLFVYITYNKFSKYRFYWILIFLSIFFISFISIYLTILQQEVLTAYNAVVKESSGKNLMSGRHVVWPIVYEAITMKPYFGWGAGSTIADASSLTLSAHNFYLQIYFQLGLIGLILYIFLISYLFYSLYNLRQYNMTKATISFFVAILMIQNFEVSLTQNHLSNTIMMWAIIGLTLSQSKRKKI